MYCSGIERAIIPSKSEGSVLLEGKVYWRVPLRLSWFKYIHWKDVIKFVFFEIFGFWYSAVWDGAYWPSRKWVQFNSLKSGCYVAGISIMYWLERLEQANEVVSVCGIFLRYIIGVTWIFRYLDYGAFWRERIFIVALDNTDYCSKCCHLEVRSNWSRSRMVVKLSLSRPFIMCFGIWTCWLDM